MGEPGNIEVAKTKKVTLRSKDSIDPAFRGTLEIVNESMKDQADPIQIREEEEKTRLLSESAFELTYPYIYLFDGMIPSGQERRGLFGRNKKVERRDSVLRDNINFDYLTTVQYSVDGDVKHLEKAKLIMNNDVDNDIATAAVPSLEMDFKNRRMTKIRFSFDTFKLCRSIKSLAPAGSILAKVINSEYESWYNFRSKATIGLDLKDLKIRISDNFDAEFNWEARKGVFKRNPEGYEKFDNISQSEYLELLKNMLTLILAREKGKYINDSDVKDFDRRFQEVESGLAKRRRLQTP